MFILPFNAYILNLHVLQDKLIKLIKLYVYVIFSFTDHLLKPLWIHIQALQQTCV